MPRPYERYYFRVGYLLLELDRVLHFYVNNLYFRRAKDTDRLAFFSKDEKKEIKNVKILELRNKEIKMKCSE